MSKTIKRFAAILISIIMICGIVMPVSAAGYGKINAKAKSVSVSVTGGGDFILKVNTATIKFKMEKNCQVRVYIMDTADRVVWYKDVANVKANKSYSVKWDGKKTNGKYVTMTGNSKKYYAIVRAGSTKTKSDYITLFKKSDFAGGVGTKSDPYQIATTAQFQKISKHANRYFIQTTDLDFGNQKIAPISEAFTGGYDGDGHKISNVTFQSSTGHASMFINLKAKAYITDINFVNCTANSSGHCAAIAVINNEGTISECTFTNVTVLGHSCGVISEDNKFGSTVVDCQVQKANVKATHYAGGFGCWNNGNMESLTGLDITVTCSNTKRAGGIVYDLSPTGVAIDCVATGTSDSNMMISDNHGIMQRSYFNGAQNWRSNSGIIE